MAWKAVHPDLTESAALPESMDGVPVEGAPVFTFGFWPPREAERFNVLLDQLQKPSAALDPVRDFQEWAKSSGIEWEVFRDMVAFSVRSWAGDLAAASLEYIEIDGRKHPKLSPDSLHLLSVNRLFGVLAMRAWRFNVLRGDQKKTSSSPSEPPG